MRKPINLYQRADTNGTFQFESAGMQKYLRDLKPDKFDDLIAMNALPARARWHISRIISNVNMAGKQITYDLPEMEEDFERNIWYYRLPGTGDVAISKTGRL